MTKCTCGGPLSDTTIEKERVKMQAQKCGRCGEVNAATNKLCNCAMANRVSEEMSAVRAYLSPMDDTYSIYGLGNFLDIAVLAAPYQRILDVGSGSGVLANYLAERGHDVTGIDLSKEAVAAAQQAGRARFLQADATRMPFPDGDFDCVVAYHVLEHIPDLDSCLSEIRRVLRPGGTLIAAVPVEVGNPVARFYNSSNLYLRFRGQVEEMDHCHFMVSSEWQACMERHGFALKEKIIYSGFSPFMFRLLTANVPYFERCFYSLLGRRAIYSAYFRVMRKLTKENDRREFMAVMLCEKR